MSLATIKRDLRRKTGVGTDAASEQWLVDTINTAAREVFAQYDLPGSVCEQFFSYSNDENQAVFPHYVGAIRAIRHHVLRHPIDTVNLGQRYHRHPWDSAHEFKFRVRNVTPLCRQLKNTAPLTISIGETQSSSVSVTVVGSTEVAAQDREVITIPAGSLSAVGRKQFSPFGLMPQGIATISKDLTACDVAVQDADGNVVSVIANNRRSARFVLVELFERIRAQTVNPAYIEVLYKVFVPELVVDSDELPVQGYDELIVWKALENTAGKPEDALAFRSKCEAVALSLINNEEQSISTKLNMGANRFIGMVDDYAYYR